MAFVVISASAAVLVPALSARASGSEPTATTTTTAPPAVVAGTRYLALGDSVAFGYREADTTPAPDYNEAGSFVGYPENIGADLGVPVTNAACPGETSASFIDTAAVSNGCETDTDGDPGYRAGFPLHVSYTGSQLAYAESFLEAHPRTRLVTLGIGLNDVLICDGISNSDGCSSEMPTVLSELKTNIATILTGLRTTAGYAGQLVIVNYYSPEPTNSTVNQNIEALDDAIDKAASPYDVTIAHSNSAFLNTSAYSNDNSCTAGLLTQLSGPDAGTCGLHPSPSGQDVLARTIETAIRK